MSDATHYKTALKDRIPASHKLIYGLGAFVNNLLAAAIGAMVIVLNLGFGMNPALVGLLIAIPRLTDAITDPLMGYISDNTRSRWGRRRPYILCGAIAVGIVFALLWQLPRGQSEVFLFWYFLIGSLIFYVAYTVFATPWVALGYELTPDYHERTRLMGTQNFIGQFAYLVAPWFLVFMQSDRIFDDVVDGAAGLALIIAVFVIAVGILPALFLRERFQTIAEAGLQEHREQPGGVSTRINEESLAAEDSGQQYLRVFVGSDADYYLEKWALLLTAGRDDPARVSAGRSAGFNWAACLLPFPWLLYRKMYVTAVIVLVAAILGGIALPGLLVGITGAAEIPAALNHIVTVVIGIICGAFGNRWYLAHARKVIARCHTDRFKDNAALEMLRRRGGTLASRWPRIEGFFSGFAATLRFRPFRKLWIATFLVFNGFMLVASFQFYVIIYYVFGGDIDAGARYAGYVGTLGAASTFFVIIFVTWLGTRIGKRRAFFAATGISMAGYALKWVCYDPDIPWLLLLPAPLMAFGLGGLFTLMPSMVADVVDMDELQTRQRREGMYGSIFWLIVKLGMAFALAAGGFLLNATGFDVALEGNQAGRAITLMRAIDAFVPFVASGIAIWVMATSSFTEQRASEVRMELERRRGSPNDPLARSA